MEYEYLWSKDDLPLTSNDRETDVMGLFGTYRSRGDWYFMSRLGIVNLSLRDNFGKEEESHVGYGIGTGYRFSESFSLELEYQDVEREASLLLLDVRFRFD